MGFKPSHKIYRRVLTALCIATVATLVSLALEQTGTLDFLENKFLDLNVRRVSSNDKPSKDIVVVLVDEASLKSMKPLVGRWPWPRSLWAEMIGFLQAAGARAVLFDVLFTEPQIPRDSKGRLGVDDGLLVGATKKGGRVFHAFQLVEDTEDEYNRGLIGRPVPQTFSDAFSLRQVVARDSSTDGLFNNHYLPVDELYIASHGAGVVEFKPDSDGLYRSTSLLRKYDGKYYPVLPVAFLADEFKPGRILLSKNHMEFGRVPVPLVNGNFYPVVRKDFTNYSAGGIFATIQKIRKGMMDGLVADPAGFQDKTVLIGASAVGIEDLKATAHGSLPGVFLHASIINDFSTGRFIHKASIAWIVLSSFVFCFVLAMLVLTAKSVWLQNMVFPALLAAHVFVAMQLFFYRLLWVQEVFSILSMVLGYLGAQVFLAFTEGREKRFLKAAFGNYISPELIELMHQSGESPKLGGDVGIRTAFFTDIQGFSSFSEKLAAQKLVELLNEYLTGMTDILLAAGGTLDKYEGDAIIAFFGAPMPQTDHAARACGTALDMQAALQHLRFKWKAEGAKWPEVVHNMRMRIGINTGEIVTGNMGSKKRMNYTMMGDSVNLAARLESSAKQYGVFCQVSQHAKEAAGDGFVFRELDTVRVVGKSIPVTTYELLARSGDTGGGAGLLAELKNSFHEGLRLYRAMKWEEAAGAFEKSLELEHKRFPELAGKPNPSKLYIERCREFRQNPPLAGWDGVFTLKSK